MRPTLYLAPKSSGKSHCFLVDADKFFGAVDEGGKTHIHFPRGVLLGSFSVGEILRDKKGVVIFPRIAVIQQWKKVTAIPLSERGLTPETAAVLLHLAASGHNVSIDDSKDTWTMNEPAMERTAFGWCPWKFIAAWCWQKWLTDGDKPAAMHKDLAGMGYKRNAATFRQMMHRMGFVTHTKPSESQTTEN